MTRRPWRRSESTTLRRKGLGSIWHTGSGPAADAAGNIYVSTAEADFNGNAGGQDFGSSVLKLVENSGTLTLAEADYFTPYNQAIISADDLDLSACAVVVLPDQSSGPTPHLLVASGKQGTVYLLDRDNMGQYNPAGDIQIVEELPMAVGAMFSTPAYWNNTVYFAGNSHPITAYALANGVLATPPVAQSIKTPGSHAPTISAHGNTNGVLWVIGGNAMWAFDAVSLAQLYNTSKAGTRGALPVQPHFSTQMVAHGKVYVGTQTNLMVYGLLPSLAGVSGNNQSATVYTTLPLPLQVQLTDPYTGQVIPGVTVSFSDGGKGGTFGNASPVTDSNGTATTTYTFAKVARTVTITASNPGVQGVTFTETATPGPAKWVVLYSGGKQSAQVTTSLPAPVVAKVSDQYGNGIAGVSVTFADSGAGGSFSATSVTTDGSGKASTIYTTSTKAGAVTLTASAAGLTPLKISETATAGPPAAMTVIGGEQSNWSAFHDAAASFNSSRRRSIRQPRAGCVDQLQRRWCGREFFPVAGFHRQHRCSKQFLHDTIDHGYDQDYGVCGFGLGDIHRNIAIEATQRRSPFKASRRFRHFVARTFTLQEEVWSECLSRRVTACFSYSCFRAEDRSGSRIACFLLRRKWRANYFPPRPRK